MARWAARGAALAVILFLGMSLWRAMAPGTDGFERARNGMMHLLPALACLFILVVSWRKAWIGAVSFAVLAGIYALWAADRPPWQLAVSIPMAVTALLYALAWWARPRT